MGEFRVFNFETKIKTSFKEFYFKQAYLKFYLVGILFLCMFLCEMGWVWC